MFKDFKLLKYLPYVSIVVMMIALTGAIIYSYGLQNKYSEAYSKIQSTESELNNLKTLTQNQSLELSKIPELNAKIEELTKLAEVQKNVEKTVANTQSLNASSAPTAPIMDKKPPQTNSNPQNNASTQGRLVLGEILHYLDDYPLNDGRHSYFVQVSFSSSSFIDSLKGDYVIHYHSDNQDAKDSTYRRPSFGIGETVPRGELGTNPKQICATIYMGDKKVSGGSDCKPVPADVPSTLWSPGYINKILDCPPVIEYSKGERNFSCNLKESVESRTQTDPNYVSYYTFRANPLDKFSLIQGSSTNTTKNTPNVELQCKRINRRIDCTIIDNYPGSNPQLGIYSVYILGGGGDIAGERPIPIQRQLELK